VRASVREIFSSVQGEGPYVGIRQIFIRFDGCNLSCRYCDTAWSGAAGHCRVEAVPGRGHLLEVANPLSGQDLLGILQNRFNAGGHHSVSITGGEPLVHAEYLAGLLPAIRQMGLKVYLETNGTLYAQLGRVIGMVDTVAMDIKLPGTAGCGSLWEKHSHFLTIARQAQVFVKIVIDDQSDIGEFKRAVDLVCGLDPSITTVIQPVTKKGRCALSPERGLELQSMALKVLKDVRIIPQAHVMMSQR